MSVTVQRIGRSHAGPAWRTPFARVVAALSARLQRRVDAAAMASLDAHLRADIGLPDTVADATHGEAVFRCLRNAASGGPRSSG